MNRNENDAKWSCYKNFFSQGLEWTFDRKDIEHYFSEYQRLAAHWRKMMPERCIDMSYESLVSEPKAALELLCGELEISFDDAMLSFYKKQGAVQTASLKQVRQEINLDSMNKGRF